MAAILVLTRHSPTLWGHWFYRSYVAVDLFFVLSGFVIGHAYDRKLAMGTLSGRDFLLVRLIRLYPVYLVSALMCGAIFVGKALLGGAATASEVGASVLVVLLSLFFLPAPHPSTASLFPTNNPFWSLFFELVVNAGYGALRRFVGPRFTGTTCVVSGAFVAVFAFRNGSLNVGFDWGFESIAAGLARATFGIFLGLWLHQRRDELEGYLPRGASPWLAAAVLCVVLLWPAAGAFDAVIDLFLVVLVFPVAVIAASRPVDTRFDRPLLALGSASYPIYVLHVPLYSVVAFVGRGREAAYAPAIGLVFVVALVALSVELEKRFDIPVRRWWMRRAFPGLERLRIDARDRGSEPAPAPAAYDSEPVVSSAQPS